MINVDVIFHFCLIEGLSVHMSASENYAAGIILPIERVIA